MSHEIIQVENVTLPDGGVYTGEAVKNFAFINICGKGKVRNMDGSTYEGEWENGRPNGYGIYTFPDGDFHKGFFDDTPNGPGYLCLNTKRSMTLGFYRNGVLNGWAISLSGGSFNCSFLQNGRVVKDHTSEFEWMYYLLYGRTFKTYKGNMIQCSSENGYIRFGAPNRTATGGFGKYLKHAIGFLFSTDGNLYVGLIKDKNELNGCLIKCTPDHQMILGEWKDNTMIKEQPIKEIDAWTGLMLSSEEILNRIKEEPEDDLPF